MKRSSPAGRLPGNRPSVRLHKIIIHLRWAARRAARREVADSQALLIGLMLPFMMMVLDGSMFNVALPAIRSGFGVPADVMAWVVTSFSLSFMIFMPLYGRLGDGLGKRTLLLIGVAIFMVGSCVNILAPSLPLLLLGKAIQGAGASGILPLVIAMISDLFPADQRGKVLGMWNSVGPAIGSVGPLLAGLLIDNWTWRAIFGPALFMGGLALFVVRRRLPAVGGVAKPHFLRTFDWIGVVLLTLAVAVALFFISSRPITGVPPLRDWRLLGLACLLFAVFSLWERRRPDPFIVTGVFAHPSFIRASLCAASRMAANGAIGFLVPLYLADVRGLSAAGIGLTMVVHSAALAVGMRLGGRVADRVGSRPPVVFGLTVQMFIMTYFALLSRGAWLALVALGLVLHGLGAGLAQPALDRAAMGQIPHEQTGAAAGLYSMIRFGGSVVSTTLLGVLLQSGLDRSLPPEEAYHTVFTFIAGVVALGVVMSLRLRA